MNQLDLKSRINIVQLYYQNSSSAAAALRCFKTQRNLVHDPFSARSVQRLIEKFEEHGVVTDLPRTGRPSVAEDIVEAVSNELTMAQSSSHLQICSARSISRTTGIPNSTVLKVLKKKLHLHPYHVTLRHELKDGDLQSRLDFANWFMDRLDVEEDFDQHILWTDEAHFDLDGSLSNRNCIIWAANNPHASVTHSLHPERVTVWCGFTADFILPPFFMEQGETINSDRYLHILQSHMMPHLPRRHNTIFMQDGAAPHTALKVRNFLREKFGDRVISRHFDWNWPARSPDLNPCDFFLWGHLKARAFLHHPSNIAELKNAISHEISNLTPDLLALTVNSLYDRLLCVLSSDGGHIE